MWNNARVSSSRVSARVRKHRFYQRDSAMCLREKSIYNATPRGFNLSQKPKNRTKENRDPNVQ